MLEAQTARLQLCKWCLKHYPNKDCTCLRNWNWKWWKCHYGEHYSVLYPRAPYPITQDVNNEWLLEIFQDKNKPGRSIEQLWHHRQVFQQKDQMIYLIVAWNLVWVNIHNFHCIRIFLDSVASVDQKFESSKIPFDNQHSRTPKFRSFVIKYFDINCCAM